MHKWTRWTSHSVPTALFTDCWFIIPGKQCGVIGYWLHIFSIPLEGFSECAVGINPCFEEVTYAPSMTRLLLHIVRTNNPFSHIGCTWSTIFITQWTVHLTKQHPSSPPWMLHFVSATGENLLGVIGLFSLSGLLERKRTQKGFSAAKGFPIW